MATMIIDRVLRAASRRALSGLSPLVPLFGDTHAARGKARGLDPQLATMLALNQRLRIPTLETMDVASARRFAARGLAPFDAAAPAMAEVIDTAIPASDDVPAIPLRIYRPRDAGDALILYFHGGGGVIGSIDSHDTWTRVVAAETRSRVASIEYRLGPEDPHPAAIDDAIAAWVWACEVAGDLGARRIVVAGDSFGALLAARIAAHAAAAGPRPPTAQVLIYPLLDITRAMSSRGDNAEGFLLTASLMRWFTAHYAPDPTTHRAASPLYFPHLAGQAPAIVVTAGFDPLCPEGQLYAERLAAAGVAVDAQHHPSLIHGFISMTGAIDAARAASHRLFESIRRVVAA
jgi:acetyl esterase